MQTLQRMVQEAHSRGLWQVFGLFLGAGWALLQVFDLFIERGFLPDWVFSVALLALVLGLPVVLATAWVQGGRRLVEVPKPGEPTDEAADERGFDAEDLFERLAELHDAAGNAPKAAEQYRHFAELWANADPALQPRVRAARARAQDLTPMQPGN